MGWSNSETPEPLVLLVCPIASVVELGAPLRVVVGLGNVGNEELTVRPSFESASMGPRGKASRSPGGGEIVDRTTDDVVPSPKDKNDVPTKRASTPRPKPNTAARFN